MAKRKVQNQSTVAQMPLERVPQSQSMLYPTDKNFNFNPTLDRYPTFDNGVNMVKGPPVADLAIPPPQPTAQDLLTEWGSTGTIIVGGILSNVDYNPELTGTARVLVYDQMRKSDATVRAALLAVKLPIMAANWYIKEFSQSARDIAIKKFIEEQLFNSMDISWNDWLRHCMNYLDYGSMLFEKVFETLPNGMIGWKKFAPRLTNTIYRWRMPDNVTEGVTQIIPTGGLRGIPIWKIMAFINEQEGEDYEGISILRAAYQAWYFKNALYKIDAIATERQGAGIPYVKIPPNASDSDRNTINELLQNLRTNEQSNLQVPVGWDVGFMDTKGSAVKTAKDMILHYDRQISKSVLAQFIELGGTSTGSFALSSDQSQLFLLAEKAHANKIQGILNTDAIRELCNLNFNIENNQYPTLEYGRIGNVDVEKLSFALYRLAAGGLISASPELEQYLTNVLDIPEAATTSEDTNLDPDSGTLPVPTKVQKQVNPVKVTSKEMNRFENKISSELKDLSHNIGYDVRELRREVEDIIYAKKH